MPASCSVTRRRPRGRSIGSSKSASNRGQPTCGRLIFLVGTAGDDPWDRQELTVLRPRSPIARDGGFGAPRPNNWHLACMEILKHWWRIDRRRLAVPCEVVCPQPAAKAKREVARDTVSTAYSSESGFCRLAKRRSSDRSLRNGCNRTRQRAPFEGIL